MVHHIRVVFMLLWVVTYNIVRSYADSNLSHLPSFATVLPLTEGEEERHGDLNRHFFPWKLSTIAYGPGQMCRHHPALDLQAIGRVYVHLGMGRSCSNPAPETSSRARLRANPTNDDLTLMPATRKFIWPMGCPSRPRESSCKELCHTTVPAWQRAKQAGMRRKVLSSPSIWTRLIYSIRLSPPHVRRND